MILFETKLGIRHFYLVKEPGNRGSRSRTNEKDVTHEIMRDHEINLGRLYPDLPKSIFDGAGD
jgi:hypothetical protein